MSGGKCLDWRMEQVVLGKQERWAMMSVPKKDPAHHTRPGMTGREGEMMVRQHLSQVQLREEQALERGSSALQCW